MKKLLPFFSMAILFTACNSSPKPATDAAIAQTEQQTPSMNPDTTGLAQFQAWKMQNELRDIKEYNQPEQPVMVAPEKVKKVRKIHSTTTPRVASAPEPVTVSSPSLPETTTGTDASAGTEGGAISTESEQTAKAEEKKGMNKSVKGAIIGGVAGAGAGAVIHKKNPVIGAVIGGVIGAGGGYVIGRKMDKKDSNQ